MSYVLLIEKRTTCDANNYWQHNIDFITWCKRNPLMLLLLFFFFVVDLPVVFLFVRSKRDQKKRISSIVHIYIYSSFCNMVSKGGQKNISYVK